MLNMLKLFRQKKSTLLDVAIEGTCLAGVTGAALWVTHNSFADPVEREIASRNFLDADAANRELIELNRTQRSNKNKA